jgi:hypothetical protein
MRICDDRPCNEEYKRQNEGGRKVYRSQNTGPEDDVERPDQARQGTDSRNQRLKMLSRRDAECHEQNCRRYQKHLACVDESLIHGILRFIRVRSF